MEYLCFVNGRDQSELVKIFEGEFFEIDRLTTNYVDSDAIRKKFKKQFTEFQTKYPYAKGGAVRIYGDSVYSLNGARVLYKKHRVAFNHIIKDKHFLRWSSRKDLDGKKQDRLIWDTYVLRGIADFQKEIVRINQFLTRLKQDDRKDFGITGGGKRYYRFVRALLNRYEDYCKIFHKPSIDDIWQEHLERLEASKVSLQKDAIGTDIILEEYEQTMLEMDELKQVSSADTDTYYSEDIDPDRLYYDIEPIYSEPLYDFFIGDNFDRYYSNIFKDDSMMIISDLSRTLDESKSKALDEVAHTCYNGEINMTTLSSFSTRDGEKLNECQIVIVYSEMDSKRLQLVLATAIQNKANVILVSDDQSLLQQYSKKFKSIIPVLDSGDKHIEMKKQLIDFFIEQYNLAKGYNK